VHPPGLGAAARAAGPGLLDYLGAGPVWPQTTKPDAAPPGGPERLAAVVAASPWPCVAIGGVGRGRIGAVRRAGASGIAVVSAICGQPDPAAAAAALRAEWDGALREPDGALRERDGAR
jgi:thiamine-phosphate pyrophosphorylase